MISTKELTVRIQVLIPIYLFFSDSFNILKFLRAAKYDIAAAKKKVISFYSFKTTVPEWYSNRDPVLPELQALLKIGYDFH